MCIPWWTISAEKEIHPEILRSSDVRNVLVKEDTGETATKTGATPTHLYKNIQAVDTHMKVDLALLKVGLVTNAMEEIISRYVLDRENQTLQYVVDEHDFVVDSIDESSNNNCWLVPLLTQSVMITIKLDTGSDVNILPLDDFNSLHNIPNLQQTKVKQIAYNGEDITVTEQALLALKHQGHTQRALFGICPSAPYIRKKEV